METKRWQQLASTRARWKYWKREKTKNIAENDNDGLAPHQTQFYENALHNIAIGKLIKIYSSFWFFGNHIHCFVDHNLGEKTKCILCARRVARVARVAVTYTQQSAA